MFNINYIELMVIVISSVISGFQSANINLNIDNSNKTIIVQCKKI